MWKWCLCSCLCRVEKKLLESSAEVQLEKGSLHINIIDEQAIMTGPAEISYSGNIQI